VDLADGANSVKTAFEQSRLFLCSKPFSTLDNKKSIAICRKNKKFPEVSNSVQLFTAKKPLQPFI